MDVSNLAIKQKPQSPILFFSASKAMIKNDCFRLFGESSDIHGKRIVEGKEGRASDFMR